ncbi:hypothetical protein BpHYR1_004133 [Brachionus plicatilis]|uniref:Uncharacterized protein n=1 Tax=Brachionus plicatilis TaxID=10195 RepID=A0A3M7QIJ0_BRAPC|nr:hypothetical protein BpHYR1_004133 [Brachionus plicatilis]
MYFLSIIKTSWLNLIIIQKNAIKLINLLDVLKKEYRNICIHLNKPIISNNFLLNITLKNYSCKITIFFEDFQQKASRFLYHKFYFAKFSHKLKALLKKYKKNA